MDDTVDQLLAVETAPAPPPCSDRVQPVTVVDEATRAQDPPRLELCTDQSLIIDRAFRRTPDRKSPGQRAVHCTQ